MYTNLKQIQIIISLLKQFSIKHIVVSPGTRHVALVHSIENDPFFKCYSVVDERSAAYFALGLSESMDVPVCITCTSATASSNYLPAIQEAFERQIQLIALTADRSRYTRFHMENQCINQVDMYGDYVKHSVDLPEVKNDMDYLYVNRSVNEALLALNHHTKGPIQINFLEPLSIKILSEFPLDEIPQCRKIDRLDNITDWHQYADILKNKKRILVLCGGYFDTKKQLTNLLNDFFESFNAVISYDHFSNLTNNEVFILAPFMAEVLNAKEINELQPDIVISYGFKIYSELRNKFNNKNIEHWHIDPEGKVNDFMNSLRKIFPYTPEVFFSNMVNLSNIKNNKLYYKKWIDRLSKITIPNLPFTNFYVVKRLISKLPENINIHLSVLNSIRLTNFFDLPQNVVCFGNIGADGIDGAFSAFLGQADSTDRLSLLIIGDLSYLYDLNASMIKMDNHVRILVINNFSGAEFHYNMGVERIPTLNKHIAAGHSTRIQETVHLSDMEYLVATNEVELENQMKKFLSPHNKPILFEVLTNAISDAEVLRKYYNDNRILTTKNKIRIKLENIVGEKVTSFLKRIINKK